MLQNPNFPGPAGGAYSAPPNPLGGGEGASCPLPKNPTSRSHSRCRPFGICPSPQLDSLDPPHVPTLIVSISAIGRHLMLFADFGNLDF